jgi:site-specific DNA recombinase
MWFFVAKTKKLRIVKIMDTYLRYIRVSTNDQESGVQMQLHVTNEVEQKLGIKISETYIDDGISGGRGKDGLLKVRAGFDSLKKKVLSEVAKKNKVSILIYDITRIGRDPVVGEEFIRLCWKTETATIDRTATSQKYDSWEKRAFVRSQFAFATADKEKKNEDSERGMRSAMEMGRYILQPKPGNIRGYRYVKTNKIKQIEPYEPEATITKDCLEKFANGTLQTKNQVREYLIKNGLTCSKDYGSIQNFLLSPLYAGYIEYLPWGITWRKATHKPLISLATHLKIKERFGIGIDTQQIENKPYKSTTESDFPLRQFIKCNECKNRMTSCWVRGSHQRYKSYFCRTKECKFYRKHINGEKLEEGFLEILQQNQLPKWKINLFIRGFELEWKFYISNLKKNSEEKQKRIIEIDKQISLLIKKHLEVESKLLSATYEKEIERLILEKDLSTEILGNLAKDQTIEQEKSRTYIEFATMLLEKPHLYWKNSDLLIKRAVQNLVFGDDFYYDYNFASRTQQKSLIHEVIRDNETEKMLWWTRWGSNP